MPVSQKNKILFVCNSSWGVVKFRIDTIEALIDAGYEVTILAPQDKYSAELQTHQRIRFLSLENLKPAGISPLSDFLLYREFKKRYAELQPHLIFHYTIKPNIFGTLAAAKLDIPSISVITGLGYAFINRPFLSAVASLLYKKALPLSAETWFLNEQDKAYFISRSIVSAGKTFILPGEGVDTEKYHGEIPVNRNTSFHFLLIGRLIKEKGIYEFATAAEILKKQGFDFRFSILGFSDPGNPSAISPDKIDSWNNQGIVKYLGSTDDVRPFIKDSDCVVLPSYREGLPVSLLEAAAMGRPLIATDTAGCREIVKEGVNGFLCTTADPESLALAMKKMAELSYATRASMGNCGRNMVKNEYNAEIIKNIYLQKIRELIH